VRPAVSAPCCARVPDLSVRVSPAQVSDMLAQHGADLWAPPRRRNASKAQPFLEASTTARVAHMRIHVERAISVIKKWVWLAFFAISQKDLISDAFYVCAMLTNLGRPLVGSDFAAP